METLWSAYVKNDTGVFIVREFVDYYHDCRPHQGIGNWLIGAEDSDVPPLLEGIEQVLVSVVRAARA